MKIALIAYNFYPSKNGVAQTLVNLCKTFQGKEHQLFTFNKYYSGNLCYDILEKKEYGLRNISLLFKDLKLLYFLFLSFLSILKDKKIKFANKIRILLFLIVKPPLMINTMKNLKNLEPFFRKIKFDLIFGGSLDGKTLPLIFLLSRIYNLRVIAYGHGNEFLIHSKLSLRTFYYRYLDKILTHTEALKLLLIKMHHLDEKLIAIGLPGLILEDYIINKKKEDIRKTYNIPNNTIVLLSVGRLIKRKNFDLVIEAINKIKNSELDLDLKYFILGTGEKKRDLEKLVDKLNLNNEVKIVGFCDNQTRNDYYKLSDIFVMPSTTDKETIEGFGLVYLEANYYKIPVIGARSGGVVEAIEDGKTGFLVKPNNLNDLVDKMLYLIKNNEKRIQMGQFSHNRVMHEFDWTKLYHRYIELFSKIIYK